MSRKPTLRHRLGRLILALSGLVALLFLLVPDTTLLVYALFVVAVFRWPRVEERALSRAAVLHQPRPRAVYALFAGLVIVTAIIGESLTWLGEYLKCTPTPALLHPQLIPDLLLGFAFYGGWIVAWLILLRFFQFTVWQVMFIQGVYGILVEQEGQVFIQGLTDLPFGPLGWLYPFAVYAAMVALPFLLVRSLLRQEGKRNGWIKYPIAWLLITLSTLLVFALWFNLVSSLGLIPEHRPICQSPLF